MARSLRINPALALLLSLVVGCNVSINEDDTPGQGAGGSVAGSAGSTAAGAAGQPGAGAAGAAGGSAGGGAAGKAAGGAGSSGSAQAGGGGSAQGGGGGAGQGGSSGGSSGGGGSAGQVQAPTMEVDKALKPDQASLPGPDGSERPLAVLEDGHGNRIHFVERELVVTTDDDDALKGLLERWKGEIVQTFSPADYKLAGLPRMHLIRIDPTAADPKTLGANLQALDPSSRGAMRVSSESGLGLFSAAASEAAGGMTLGVNWVSQPSGFLQRTTTEAPAGIDGQGYSTNAFDWPYMTSGNALDIGVGDAWRALALAGKLDGPRIGLGVIDGGFVGEHPDFPPGERTYISAIPFITDARGVANPMQCSGTPCPWHGLGAALTAMGNPDNGYGAAGPAGPVAKPIMTLTLGDMFTTIAAIPMTRDAGAKIITMSFGAPVPAALGFTVLPLDLTTNIVRGQGVLLFASAANADDDVDEEDCLFGVCWEDTWHYMCENTGVTCIGATNLFDTAKVNYSNWGSKDDGGTVDLWAPGTEFVGMDRDPTGFLKPPAASSNMADIFTGTSAASPFVAGIAALVWTANPSLTADQVEQILLQTAKPGGSPQVKRFVQAYDAVLSALGGAPNEPPSVQITGPAANASVNLNQSVTFISQRNDPEDGANCCNVSWNSDIDGPLGNGPSISRTFTTEGPRTITATVTDSGGQTSTATVQITVVNAPPAVTINNPPSPLYATQPFELTGQGTDINEPEGKLACSALQWSVNNPSVTLAPNGCKVTVTAASAGTYTVTLRGTDPQGLQSETSRQVVVSAAPVNYPPSIKVTLPLSNASWPHDQKAKLQATATDPEGNTPVTITWTVTSYDGSGNVFKGPVQVGQGTLVEFYPSTYGLHDWLSCQSVPGQKAQVTVTATDSLGNSKSVTIPVEIICIPG